MMSRSSESCWPGDDGGPRSVSFKALAHRGRHPGDKESRPLARHTHQIQRVPLKGFWKEDDYSSNKNSLIGSSLCEGPSIGEDHRQDHTDLHNIYTTDALYKGLGYKVPSRLVGG